MIPFSGVKPTEAQRAAMKARPSAKPRRIVTPAMRARWPLAIRAVARLRAKGDSGVGDTVHRVMGVAGEGWEWFWRAVGKPCHCADRRAYLNRRFPY